MLKRILFSTCLALSAAACLWAGQAYRTTTPLPPSAGTQGRVTLDEFIGRNPQTNPVGKLKVYLIKFEDSRPLQELQQRCRRATAETSINAMTVYHVCTESLARAVELIPTLPSVARTETDRDGFYQFDSVPAAGRYQVVGVKVIPDGEPLVIVGVTSKLKAGERVTMNLSANNPWTGATL